MPSIQIIRTRKDGPDRDRRIDAVELVTGEVLSLDQAIARTLRGVSYWTMAYGRAVPVYVRTRGIFAVPFLTTAADGFGPNNLLQLPDISVTRGLGSYNALLGR